MVKKYDLIVAGAGPAGLLAAKTAAENGLDVLLLESKRDPAKLDRACLQTLDSANEYMHHDLYITNQRGGRLCFPAHGFSVPYDGKFINLYSWQIYTPSGHLVQSGDPVVQRAKGDAGKISVTLDKEALLRCMLAEAEAAGARLMPGTPVQGVSQTTDGVRVTSGSREFEGRYLVAADGVNSKIAAMMGLNQGRRYYFTLWAISLYVEGVEPPDKDTVIVTYGYLPESPIIMFMVPLPLPGGDVYHVMPISLRQGVNLKQAYEYFLRKDHIGRWFKDARIMKTLSAHCNAYAPIPNAVQGRVLLAGDVGAAQELEMTGALISGHQAGNCVTLAVHEADLGLPVTGLERYQQWWLDSYINHYSHEEYLKAWSLPYTFDSEAEIDYVFGLIKEPFSPAFNPYTMPKHMGEAIKKIVPTLKAERPDLLAKLGRTRMPTREFYADLTSVSKPV